MNHSYYTQYGKIKLRPLTEEDIEPLRILRNKHRCFFLDKSEIAEDQQREWYKNYLLKDDDIMFSISALPTDFLGAIALYNIDYNTLNAEFGRIVVSDEAPRFTGTYAIEALLLFARDVLKLLRVSCSVLINNQRAKSIYERLGFKLVTVDNKTAYYQLDLMDLCSVE